MSQFNDGMFRDSNLRIRNVTQAQFNAQKVNFNPDVIYRVDGVLHLPDENTETYASAVTATRDASGNVTGFDVGGDVAIGRYQMSSSAFSAARDGVTLPSSRQGFSYASYDYLDEFIYDQTDPDSGADSTTALQSFLESAYLIAVSLKNTAYDNLFMRNRVRVTVPRSKIVISSPIVVPEFVDLNLLGVMVRSHPASGSGVTYDGDTTANACNNIYQPALILGAKSTLSNCNLYCNPTGTSTDRGSGIACGKTWTASALAVASGGIGYQLGDVLTTANYSTSPYYGATATVASVDGSGAVTSITLTSGGAYSMPIKMQQRVWSTDYGFSIFDDAGAYVTSGGTGSGCTLTATWKADFVGGYYDSGASNIIGDTLLGVVRIQGCGTTTDGTYGPQFGINFNNLNHEFDRIQITGGYTAVSGRNGADIRGNMINAVLSQRGVDLYGITSFECPNVVLDSVVSASVVLDACSNIRMAGEVFFASGNAGAYPTAPSASGYQFNVGQYSSGSRCNNINLDFSFQYAGKPNNPGGPLAYLANVRGSSFKFYARNSTASSAAVTGPYQLIRVADIGTNFETSNSITGSINNVAGVLWGAPASVTATFGGQPTAGDTITLGGVAITFVASGATGAQVNIGATASNTASALVTYINTNSTTLRMRASAASTVVTIISMVGGVAANSVTIAKSGTYPSLSSGTFSGGTAQPTCDIRVWDDSVGGYAGPSGQYEIVTQAAPTSATGQNKAAKGSSVMDVVNANLYINAGDELTPSWKLVTRAA